MFTRVHWVHQLGSARIGIMARPRGDEWLGGELERLKEQGIQVLVSLLEREENDELGLKQEAQLAEGLGLDLRSHPLADRGVPEHWHDFMCFITDLEQAYRQGKTLVVHCRMGIGRSSLTIAAVLMRLGYAVEEAFEIIAHARGVAVPDTVEQRQWLKLKD